MRGRPRAGRPRRAAGALVAALLVGSLPPPGRSQEGPGPAEAEPAVSRGTARPDPFDAEGALANDTFVPTDEAATEALRRGDERLARARAAAPAGAEAPVPDVQTLDLWGRALEEAAEGATVPAAGGSAGEPALPGLEAGGAALARRRTEAVVYAVLRRLDALSPAGRAAWRARREPLAQIELTGAGANAEALAALERRHPGTRSAVLALLCGTELHLERGELAAAGARLDRARLHRRLLDAVPGTPAAERADRGLDAALERRAAVLRELARGPEAAPEPWRRARALRLERVLALDARRPSSGLGDEPHRPGRGLVPDLCYLDDGSVAVRSADLVHLLPPEGERRPFHPIEIVEALDLDGVPEVSTARGSWPLALTTDGRRLFLVAGRARGNRGNVLLALEPPAEASAPVCLWALSQEGLATGGGAQRVPEREPSGLEPGRWELQPGAVVTGGLLVVQARQWALEETAAGRTEVDETQTRAWVLGLDPETGRIRWQRRLALGADVGPDLRSRFGGTPPWSVAAQPLAASAGGVLAGTHLGLAALIEPLDGRVAWTFRSRRRPAEGDGWSGTAPPILAAAPGGSAGALGSGPAGALPGAWLWGPADGDFLYALRATPLAAAGEPLLVAPPVPIGSALDLVRGGPTQRGDRSPGDRSSGERSEPRAADAGARAVLLARAGGRAAVESLAVASGERVRGLVLDQGERFAGTGLASAERALVASDRRLYLLDRTRELYLVQELPLAPPDTAPAAAIGGSVHARGRRVDVLSADALWTFAVVE